MTRFSKKLVALKNSIILAFLLPINTSYSVFAETQHASRIYTLDQVVNTFDPSKVSKTKVGYQYWFADKSLADGKTLKLSVVDPYQATHAPHKHAEDEFFFVLEGTAEFHLDGKTTIVGPMTSFYCPAEQLHGIKNAGNTVLKYLVIKKYQQH